MISPWPQHPWVLPLLPDFLLESSGWAMAQHRCPPALLPALGLFASHQAVSSPRRP